MTKIIDEAKILEELKEHRNIITLYKYELKQDSCMYQVLELMPMNLETFIKN